MSTPPPSHFAHLPTKEGPRKTYVQDDDGNFVAVATTGGSGEDTSGGTTTTPDSSGEREVGEYTIAPRKPQDSVSTVVTEGALRAISRANKKAERQGGPDVLATLINNSSLFASQQASAGGGDSRRGQGTTGNMQIETPALVAAALNPSAVEIDQFVDVGLHMSRTETREKCRPFQHTEKASKKLTFKKTRFSRPDELASALKNYVMLLDATVLLKPEILSALLLLVEDALELAEKSPHEDEIFRPIAAFFFQEVEHVLRRVGASSCVDDVVQMIYDINFDDPSATHNSCITAYHIHRYTAAVHAASNTGGGPNNPAPAREAGSAADAGAKPLSNGASKKASASSSDDDDDEAGDGKKKASFKHCLADLGNKFGIVNENGQIYTCAFGDKCAFRHRASKQAAGTAMELLRTVKHSGSKDAFLRTELAKAIRAATDLPK